MAWKAAPSRGRSSICGRQGRLRWSRSEITRPRLDCRRVRLASKRAPGAVVDSRLEWWYSTLTSSNDESPMLPRRINRPTTNQIHLPVVFHFWRLHPWHDRLTNSTSLGSKTDPLAMSWTGPRRGALRHNRVGLHVQQRWRTCGHLDCEASNPDRLRAMPDSYRMWSLPRSSCLALALLHLSSVWPGMARGGCVHPSATVLDEGPRPRSFLVPIDISDEGAVQPHGLGRDVSVRSLPYTIAG